MGEFKKEVSRAHMKLKAAHDMRSKLSGTPKKQRAAVVKANSAGWVLARLVDDVVILVHPNLERRMRVFKDGTHERFKPMKETT